jgi:hypothetical protein
LDTPSIAWIAGALENEDPLWLYKWWNANKFEYPLMAKAARDYLPVPAVEVAIERLFSGARDVLGLRRWSLKAETMRILILLKDCYKSWVGW